MKIFVDIDETICINTSDRDYSKARPIKNNILKINKLYEEGHNITYWSARGSGTGIDWNKITKKQFKKWQVKYHNLSLGQKPIYDLLIDDKVLNIKNINKLDEHIK